MANRNYELFINIGIRSDFCCTQIESVLMYLVNLASTFLQAKFVAKERSV